MNPFLSDEQFEAESHAILRGCTDDRDSFDVGYLFYQAKECDWSHAYVLYLQLPERVKKLFSEGMVRHLEALSNT